jgi:hypothetical protein
MPGNLHSPWGRLRKLKLCLFLLNRQCLLGSGDPTGWMLMDGVDLCSPGLEDLPSSYLEVHPQYLVLFWGTIRQLLVSEVGKIGS